MQSLHEIIRNAEANYTQGTTRFGKYVEFSMYETIETITAYLNSKHISGDQDSLGRDKPFFNIVTAAVNVWYRATDLGRLISIKPDKAENTIPAFVATVHLHEWAKREGFWQFVNQWGRRLSQYGSAVVKFVDKGGSLSASVVPWSRMIVDPVDFEALPRIEKLYKTPAQLLKIKEYDQEAVKKLIDSRQSRETLDGQQKDTQNEFIELYELHGELSLAVYKRSKGQMPDDGDEDRYFQQMHVLAYNQTKGPDGKSRFDDFTLYSGREAQDPYMLTHLIEEEGRTLSIGAVEYMFDAQWMQNHTIKQWKDQMDLASKIVFQSADPQFIGKNVLSNIEVGDILKHEVNMPLERVPNEGHDITSLKGFADQWKVLAQELTSTPDAYRGNTLPSGASGVLAQLLSVNAGSLFNVMGQTKKDTLAEMLRRFVIPHLKRKMDTSKEIAATLEEHDIRKIDAMYVPRAAIKAYNERSKEAVLNGEEVESFNPMVEEANVRQGLADMGNVRSFIPSEIPTKTWKSVLKDLEWEVDIVIADETQDKQLALTTLSQMFQAIATNPQMLEHPVAKMLFNKTLSQTGSVSPLEIPVVVGAGPSALSPQKTPTP